MNCGSISNIYISPYDDYAEGEQNLEWKYESQTVPNSYDPSQWDLVKILNWPKSINFNNHFQVGNDPVCNSGTAQSPIDIVTGNVNTENSDVGQIHGTLFEEDIEGYMANTGRMVQFVLLGFLRPTLEGGPLLDKK